MQSRIDVDGWTAGLRRQASDHACHEQMIRSRFVQDQLALISITTHSLNPCCVIEHQFGTRGRGNRSALPMLFRQYASPLTPY